MAGTDDEVSKSGPRNNERQDDEHRVGARADALGLAYEERSRQLNDARGALAGAVDELTTELHQRRAEVSELKERLDAISKRAAELEGALHEAQQLIEVMRNLKVVRWTALPRRFVYRLRARRQ